VGGLYLNAGYMYQQFKVQEQQDIVDFKTKGYKFGFKYVF